MNYIKHLNKVFEIIYDDERLTPYHVALYFSLFQQWNLNRFKNPVVFKRLEIMKGARIGSLTTYTKCLKELHEWEYVNYNPSRNPYNSSINMYSFCTSIDTGTCTDTCTPSVHDGVHLLYINNNKQDKLSKGENHGPTQNEVMDFFKEKKWEEQEADKFFFHYEATGWCAGNKTKIVDWKAAAHKWILNKSKFDNNGNNNKSKLSAAKTNKTGDTRNKKYSEPL